MDSLCPVGWLLELVLVEGGGEEKWIGYEKSGVGGFNGVVRVVW